jgi:tetratricopeptide (TPR) repeat protein
MLIVGRSSNKVFLGLAWLSLGLADVGTAPRADGDEPRQAGQTRPFAQGGNASNARDETTPRPSEAEACAAIVRRALAEAEGIPDPAERAEALLRLARAQLDRRELAAARSSLASARQAALAIKPDANPTIPHPIIRVAQFQERAVQHLAARQTFRMALRVIQAERPGRQAQDWVNLIRIQREALGPEGMIETDRAYREFLKTHLERMAPPVDPATEIIGKVGAGELTPEKALEMIRDPATWAGPDRAGRQFWALLRLVGVLDRGDRGITGPVLDEARGLLEDLPAFNRADLLGSLAEVQRRLGLYPEAIATASSIDPSILPDERQRDRAAFQKAQTFLRIAEDQAKAGDRAGAATTARRVLDVADRIRDESYREYPLGRSAELLSDAGDIDGSRLVLTRCRGPFSRFSILRSIAAAQVARGDPQGAHATFQEALPLARRCLDDARASARTERDNGVSSGAAPRVAEWVGQVASLQARLGDLPAALETLESCPAGRERDQARIALARDRAEAGDVDSARSLVETIKAPDLGREAWIAVACAIPEDAAASTRSASEDRRPPAP